MGEDIYKKIFSKNIKYYMEKNNKNQTDLMNDLGFSSSTVSNWCTGLKLPRMDKVQMLADYFGIGKSDLLDDKTDLKQYTRSKGIKINVLGRVAAGIPIDAVEDIIDTEEIAEDLARTGKFFGLQIRGDSMEPRIEEGDVVIVRQQENADSGSIVIALINGDEATCKKLVKHEDGISLVSLNPKYEPMYFSKEAIMDMPVRILGKVVELRGKF